MHAHIYTDGSALKQHGPSGWGAYIETFDDVVKESFKYNRKGQLEVWPTEANPKAIIHELMGNEVRSTSNRMEITAAIQAINYCKDKSLQIERLFTDSMYVLNGICKWSRKWKANDWFRPDGTEVPNKDLWIRLIKAVEDYALPITWVHSKGHSGIHGNEEADRLAGIGSSLADSGKSIPLEIVAATELVEEMPKPKKVNYNRMISHRRIYFHNTTGSVRTKDGKAVYYAGAHGKEDSGVGRNFVESAHSVVILNEPDAAIDYVMEAHKEQSKGSISRVGIMKLDTVLNSKNYGELLDPLQHTLVPIGSIPGLKIPGAGIACYDLDPPGFGFQQMDAFDELRTTLEEFLGGSDKYTVTDITDVIYDREIKGKGKKQREAFKIKSTITTSTKSLTFDIKMPNGKTDRLAIKLGHVAPPRNTFSALAAKKPSVNIITWPFKNGYHYAFVVQADTDAGIWTSHYANLRFIG